jgi:CRISPR system Cascade subunit CasD
VSVLLLRLAAPLQAWGAASRFAYRHTEIAPTKSGVLGLLAAAKGIRRTEPLTELLGLSFGVRIDQPGQVMRDFQTARPLDGGKPMPLTHRYYLADACFLAAVAGPEEVLVGLHEALARPHFPLYLGRRSCPPAGPISLGVHSGSLLDALDHWPWQAAPWHQRHAPRRVSLQILRDAQPGEKDVELVRDQPVTFDPAHRVHEWRAVVRTSTEVDNPSVEQLEQLEAVDGHDPMPVLGG